MPELLRQRLDWVRVSGCGPLFTWVRVHLTFLPGFEQRIPYTTALVELEEDPSVRLATLLDDSRGDTLRIGLPVEVYFDRIDERLTLPRFRACS